MKTMIEEGSRGFLFKNGKFVKMLGPGKYFTFGGSKILTEQISNSETSLFGFDPAVFGQDKEFCAQTTQIVAKSGELTLHFVDGVFFDVLRAGKHIFWNVNRRHEFLTVDLSQTRFPADFPDYLYSDPLVSPYVCKIEVGEKQKALLYLDKKFDRLLDVGTYYFVKGYTQIDCVTVPTCTVTRDVVGQEILTADKVSLRINCACTYRIRDYVKAVTETDDYGLQLHMAVQLALRTFVESRRLDEILSCKNEMAEYMLGAVRDKGAKLYLSVEQVAVKDIILPGEIRDIMNTVLVAEKRAQANVITRREEVASTRSLLNTARLMDENETLYKLKELEYIERICEKVGNINLNGNADMLTQLTGVLCAGKKDGE